MKYEVVDLPSVDPSQSCRNAAELADQHQNFVTPLKKDKAERPAFHFKPDRNVALWHQTDMAGLIGDVRSRGYLLVFVFVCSAVALGAALVAPRSPILTSMGFNEVIMTFVVVVLGGIGSIGGALAAGLGLGLFIAFFGAFIAQAYTTAAAFAVLLALLVIRPAGLATK